MSASAANASDRLTPGFATPEGTAAYRDRLAGKAADGHFRPYRDLWVSSIGIGTYLGEEDEETDRLNREAVGRCLELGCNVIDTSINYRSQRSERSIGQALRALFSQGKAQREEVVVATKGGFLPFDGSQPAGRDEFVGYVVKTFLKPGIIQTEDIVGGCHCMTPAYLQHQLDASRRNLGFECLDVYYLHNPETQLQEISREEFISRIRAAFETLEQNVSEGKIRVYGTATWTGYRQKPEEKDYLSLADLVQAAEEVGGEDHHFRAIQLPLNLAMPEAIALSNQPVDGEMLSLLDAAEHFGISVMASASIFQGRVAQNLPTFVSEAFPGFTTDAQRAIQFVRSTPGMTVALVGMKQPAHIEEDLAVAAVSPASAGDYMKLFRSTGD
ncbi:MAG: aldo/keto reductase [Nitrospinota bacterium]